MSKTNVLLFFENTRKKFGNKVALGIKSNSGWRELTYNDLGILSERLANYLIRNGINRGNKVAIISESNPELGVAIFASILSGAVTIPLDIKLTPFELKSLLNDCKPKILLVSKAFLEVGLKLKDEVDSIEQVVITEDTGVKNDYPSLYNIPDENGGKWRLRSMRETAFIIYTSGTTGIPKGVEVTFKNILSQVEAVGKCFPLGPNDRLLSILPMNHLFELSVTFFSFLNRGVSIYYPQSLKPKDFFSVLNDKKVTFKVVVPAFLKVLKTGVEIEISQSPKFKKMLFNFNLKLAKFIPFYSIRKLMFATIHKKLGGHLKTCISGGAPLDITVAKFFETIGIRILEGYGLSETSPVVAVNVKGKCKLGSVGRALPGVQVKTDETTGELLVKGDNIMKGYYNRPDLTAEIIDKDGWLHSGDIARIDKDGFVYITGRIKNMIVLNGGKKVFPEDVEAVLEPSPKFAEVCVFGSKRSGGQKDGTEDVVVAIVPSQQILDSVEDDEELYRVIKEEVKILSEKLSSYKRPSNIIITKDPFPRTSTRKVKRNEVKKVLIKVGANEE